MSAYIDNENGLLSLRRTILRSKDISFGSAGDAGGQLGLVLGASCITILEVIDLVIMFAINWFKSPPRRKNTEIS